MFAVRQKPSRDVNSAQEDCGIVGHRAPLGGEIDEQHRVETLRFKDGVEKRRRGSGWKEEKGEWMKGGGVEESKKPKHSAVFAMLCWGNTREYIDTSVGFSAHTEDLTCFIWSRIIPDAHWDYTENIVYPTLWNTLFLFDVDVPVFWGDPNV